MKNITSILFMTLGLLCYFCSHSFSQTINRIDSVKTFNLARRLHISFQKADQILAVTKINQTKIDALMKNEKVSPNQKMEEYRTLVKERQYQMSTLLGPAELDSLQKMLGSAAAVEHQKRMVEADHLHQQSRVLLHSKN